MFKVGGLTYKLCWWQEECVCRQECRMFPFSFDIPLAPDAHLKKLELHSRGPYSRPVRLDM